MMVEIKRGGDRLEIKGFIKSYNGKRVVDRVDMEINRGEVVGLLGPNGAGKTTTFYMTVGMIKADDGKVLLNEEDLTDLPMYIRARRGITYLPQEPSVFKKLTVLENLLIVLENLPIPRSLIREKAMELLRELGIQHLAEQKAHTLSGGERRRLEITRALSISPKFLLLDEPFAGIDPLALDDIKRIIGELKAKGIGIMISDHNVRETLSVCDRAYIINEGKIIESGSPEHIVNSPVVRKFYLGESFKI